MRSRLAPIYGILILTSSVMSAGQDEGLPAGELVVAAEELAELPAEPAELLIAANTAYEEGDYGTAIERYNVLVSRGVAGGQVHFNLGNAHLRNGELGRAIAEFRRGRNLLPRDEDIRANLSFARDSTKDAIVPPEPSPVLSTLLFWHYGLNRRELAAVTVLTNLFFWGVAIGRIFRRDSEILRWLFIVLLVVLLATGGSFTAHHFVSRPVVVVVPQEIDAFTAPDVDSVVRFKLHAGTEIRVKDEREGWLRIALPDGQQGWIETVWTEVVDG